MKTVTLLFGFLLIISQALNAQTCKDSLRAKAERGDVAAMWEMGNYYDGIGKNDSAAFWLLKAYEIEKKNAKGLYYLGLFYGPKYDGKKYLIKSAKLGNINAALTLFLISKPEYIPSLLSPYKEWKKYQNNEGECKRYASLALSMTPDEEFHSYVELADAAEWTGDVTMQKHYAIKALNNGEYGAISYMAKNKITPNDDSKPKYLYEYADYLRKHALELGDRSDEWISLYRKSAQKGYSPAQLQMGYLYLHGYSNEVKSDTLKAIAWCKESVKNGNTNAKVILASIYQQGLYCQKNPELAFNMFKQIADTLDTDQTYLTCTAASYHVGLCYYYGLGVKKDYSMALQYLLKVIDKRGITNLYIENRHMDIEYIVGSIYYELGDTKALGYLRNFSHYMTDHCIHQDVLKKISSCYRFGRCGVNQDVSLADKYDAEAAHYGDSSNKNIQDAITERAISTFLSLLETYEFKKLEYPKI